MAVAVALGALAGVLGFAPLALGLRLTKRTTATSNFGPMAILMLCLLVSFAVLFASAIACVTLARDVVLYFALAEAISLCVVTIGFGVSRILMKK